MQAGPLHARCIDSVPENSLNGCLEATLSPGSGTNSRTIWVFQLSRIKMWLWVPSGVVTLSPTRTRFWVIQLRESTALKSERSGRNSILR